MNRQILALLAAAALATLAACGTTPTASESAPTGEWQANTAPADTSANRVPNLFGSGN